MEYEEAFKVIFWILSGIMFVVAVGILMFLQSIYHSVYAKINGKTLEEELEKLEELSENVEIKPVNNIFSEREMEIVFFTIKGYSAVEIAKKINRSKRTIERHKENMINKTDLENFIAVSYYVLSNKFLTIEEMDNFLTFEDLIKSKNP